MNYDKLIDIYKLKNLTRYNQRVRIKDESVAEHSYFVTLICKMICSNLEVSKDVEIDSMTYALVHDLPEIYISDVPHPVKASNPELDKLLTECEDQVMKTIYPEYYELYCDVLGDRKPLVKAIVKTADVLSVIQYALLEVNLGNTQAHVILEDGIKRYGKCKDLIKSLTGKDLNILS